MKFWDASAVVPLLVAEQTTPGALDLYRGDPLILVWWGTEVECVSALARLERAGDLDVDGMSTCMTRLRTLKAVWNEVDPTPLVRETAQRLLRVHDLRAADSLQLAAAIVACENRPAALDLVCLDRRLGTAAQREGFNVLAFA